MENKIVRMKTFIVTISLLVLLFLVGIGGLLYYYENKVDELERMLETSKNSSGITIVPERDENKNINVTNTDVDTNVNNVIAE